MTPEKILQRLRAPGPTTIRTAPSGPAGAERPRGDHDLNPDLYRPGMALTPAAVLVPLVKRPSGVTVLLTKRTDHLHDHAGQVSFPGGRIDPQDRDAEAAALRETEEEVGLPRRHVRIAGRLDTYVTRTGFEVTPLVGLVTPPFPLAPDSFEVAEVFEVPLDFLLDPGNRQTRSRHYEGKERYFYVYRFGGHTIWGATAGMLVNLEEVLSRP
ncbi:MAG: CoA pyrophosphatase [Kiloniellales bacterium]|nr:CoA pyrophosphatase [Kiloniellales bacterium]